MARWCRSRGSDDVQALALGTTFTAVATSPSTVTGLDRYTGFYGLVDNTPDRLRANARKAAIGGRLDESMVGVG